MVIVQKNNLLLQIKTEFSVLKKKDMLSRMWMKPLLMVDIINWPAYWSRIFWKAYYPRKAAFHLSGLKDAASHSQLLLFPIPLMMQTDTNVSNNIERQTIEKEHSTLIMGLNLFVNLLPETFCYCSLCQPQFGLYLIPSWRPLFPECLQMKEGLSQ